MTDYEIIRSFWYVALLLMLLPLVLPLARSGRKGFAQAAVWVLALGFLFAFYRIGEWLLAGPASP